MFISIVFFLLAVLHIGILLFYSNIFLLTLITKCLPTLYLVLYILDFKRKHPKLGINFFFWGLVFSLGGDFLLGLDNHLPNSFIYGLGSFLVAQICYSIAFSKGASLQLKKSIYFYLFGFLAFYYLYPALEKGLLIPVFIYMLALTTMAWRASARKASANGVKLSTLGAVSFIISDAMLAFTKFRGLEIPFSQVWIMITYYLALYLLVQGFKK